MKRQRAYVHDEGTAQAPYFIMVENQRGMTSGGQLRFNNRANANLIANAINKAYENEGRLFDQWEDGEL